MAPTIPLSVAIDENPGILHWSLFIEAENDDDTTIIQVLGARQRYFPEIRERWDPRRLDSLLELLPLCRVDVGKIEMLKNIAYATPIRNDLADWSCQDWILAVLGKLEDASIIDAADGDYIRNKEVVAAKRESWP
ncbi:hypothetical protein N7452_005605 [Penicillium brevicompactum]|uniref:Uncharacterized protein n=1 Tax=Penicillium brevicompactum TaxID=5074 RepID=A0A9W9QJ37_PENBR|nr:hypothetical protein N7452_005605 [Penicillium brevicompactum]